MKLTDWIVSYIPSDKSFGYEYNKSDLSRLDYDDLMELREVIEDIVIDVENELITLEKEAKE